MCPPSAICMKSMDTLYTAAGGKCFSVERPSTALSDYQYEASPAFMGCRQEDSNMLQMINELEALVSGDSTESIAFNGDISAIVAKKAANGGVVVLDGSLVGVKNVHGCPVTVDALFEGAELPDGLWGVVLPEEEIESRTSYGWFDRMSAKQVLESSVPFSVYFRWALQR